MKREYMKLKCQEPTEYVKTECDSLKSV